MHHIIYVSQASKAFSPLGLATLLTESRGGNEQRDVSGALVYGAGHFMQVLEGESDMVNALYNRIARDPRHQNVCKLADKAIEKRLFAYWSMAFDEVSADQFKELLSYFSPEQLAGQLVTTSSTDKLLLDRLKEMVCA
jgi:hypothetical protein